MKSKYLKIFAYLVSIIVIALVQISFISALPGWLDGFNVILLLLLFMIGLQNFEIALWWAFGLGLVLDFFSFSFFGAYTLSLLIVVVLIQFLLKNFITNRSLYSFLTACFFALFFYELFIWLFTSAPALFFADSVRTAVSTWLEGEIKVLAINLIAVPPIYFLVKKFSKKLKPVLY